jgi:hypothetical protein
MNRWLLVMLLILTPALWAGGDFQEALKSLRQAGRAGQGGVESARAWHEVSQADVNQLPELLAAMDGSTDLGRSWLRAAIDAVLERGSARPLPTAALQTFLSRTEHDPQARRLAYELLVERDKSMAVRLLPALVDDRSLELRRQAISCLLTEADRLVAANKKTEAQSLYEKAFNAARDKEQVDEAARKLRQLGRAVDLARHYGFILKWKLIGPFPNVKEQGVHTVYPPEKGIDLSAEYDGKAGKVRWRDYVCKSEPPKNAGADPSASVGQVDVNAGIGKHTEAVAYAYTEFPSDAPRNVEIRLGCYTTFKMWVNGRLALERYDAYTGSRMDSYSTRVSLQPGKNTILLKLCQDVPPDPLPKVWHFRLRICDDIGTGISPAPLQADKNTTGASR